uniref:Uncharacterized protein n=1 Tax=Physcomitrium patens TaxID=3218 RepID=A0A2K1JTN0_PHYPA|nr:hypothetical protein PHYPA_014664 [Physcomitrium patens]
MIELQPWWRRELAAAPPGCSNTIMWLRFSAAPGRPNPKATHSEAVKSNERPASDCKLGPSAASQRRDKWVAPHHE